MSGVALEQVGGYPAAVRLVDPGGDGSARPKPGIDIVVFDFVGVLPPIYAEQRIAPVAPMRTTLERLLDAGKRVVVIRPLQQDPFGLGLRQQEILAASPRGGRSPSQMRCSAAEETRRHGGGHHPPFLRYDVLPFGHRWGRRLSDDHHLTPPMR